MVTGPAFIGLVTVIYVIVLLLFDNFLALKRTFKWYSVLPNEAYIWLISFVWLVGVLLPEGVHGLQGQLVYVICVVWSHLPVGADCVTLLSLVLAMWFCLLYLPRSIQATSIPFLGVLRWLDLLKLTEPIHYLHDLVHIHSSDFVIEKDTWYES